MSNMFINTRAVSRKIVGDFKEFGGLYAIAVQLVYIAFLIYSLCTERGFFPINVTLIVLSSLFFVFLVITFIKRDFFSQDHKRSIKHTVRITSLLVKAVSLCITLYGIHIAVSEFNTASILFAVFMLFAWLCGVILEISRFILERYTSLMASALSKDVEPFVKVYKRITFKGYEGRREYDADADVDRITGEYKIELSAKAASQKALREAEKLIEREKKRTASKKKREASKEKRSALAEKTKSLGRKAASVLKRKKATPPEEAPDSEPKINDPNTKEKSSSKD